MKLGSFRELLVKKSDDSSLQNLIKFIREDVLVDLVMESLEKMADSKLKGDTANVALRNFGTEMDPDTHPAMIRDALGHHASQYKAAAESKNQKLANAHARQFYDIMNIAQKVQKHSDGKLDVNAVSPHAWERNAKLGQYNEEHPLVLAGKRNPGDFVTDTRGWSHTGKDFSFLQQPPHEAYSGEISKHGHNDAYPMEQTRINGKYIPIDNVDPKELAGYKAHEFDHHPIMKHGQIPAGKRTPEDDVKYDNEVSEYEDSQHMSNYWDRHSEAEKRNPEGYKRRGETASDPVHKPTGNPLDISSEK